MQISIPGHSEFNLEIKCHKDTTTVVKRATNHKNSVRLEKQAAKQILFYKNNMLPWIKTPKVLGETWEKDLYSFEMKYINNIDYVYFMECKGKKEVQRLFQNLCTFVEHNVEQSNLQHVKKDILNTKYEDIKQRVSKKKSFDFTKIDNIIRCIPDTLDLPVGLCHGDLTLSNILLGSRTDVITVIDFLDSFIETPLNDIVKLRQDTKYKWSLNLYEHPYDIIRINHVLNYFDEYIDNYFSKYPFYTNYYKLFQLFNLLRVLQYSKKKQITDTLCAQIGALVETYE